MDIKPFVEIIKNRSLSSKKNQDPVQIRPQKMHVRLRKGEERMIVLKFSKAEDYPVDLYYLMDLSASMESYREQLSKLGDKLAEAMKQLTSNFRLGFGSFVDKVILPMTNTQPDKLKSPCTLSTGKPCAPPYGYKNQMPLTENVALFKSRVKEAPVSGNLDRPEGGFDAIMQAMACTNEIGWRQKARHILVFSTDASFHIAGDGRLAGIVEPNDESCHLDENGFYTYSLLQDYPSVSQINRKAKEQNINIIFAVPKHMNTTYHLLSKSITSSSIGLLENDAKNVVSLVSEEYEKLVDSITMIDNAPEMIDIRYFTKCLNKNSILKQRRGCEGIRTGNEIEFQIVLTALDCPSDSSQWHQTLKIGPRGINEYLEIDIEIICQCPCETVGNQGNIEKSLVCNDNGNLVCGACQCYEGFYGNQCECKGVESGSNSFVGCRANNDSDICSGRGVCKCGVCNCAKRSNPQETFYGTYCECDNFSCKRSDGLVCGGRGNCECGTCNCLPGWIGEACDCKESNSTCIPSEAVNEVCSGRGDCVCGSCRCHETKTTRYTGLFCEECPTCQTGQQCEELRDYVECLAYKSGKLWKNKTCDLHPHHLEILLFERADEIFKDEETNIRVCHALDTGGCSFVFKYELIEASVQNESKHFKIMVQKEKNCPSSVDVEIALSVIASTVLIGFTILSIWKVLTVIHERREFAKFEKERILVKWEKEDNPLYKEATRTFNNPTFKENVADQEN